MSDNYKFFQNNKCNFFPCHNVSKEKLKDFNCMFCYCPLYTYANCGGNYIFLSNGIKSCEKCTIPHFDYDYIINKLIELNEQNS
jgi:Zn-finger protein